MPNKTLGEWYDIETAPKDGTPVLFGSKTGVEIGWFDWCPHVRDYYASNGDSDVLQPTHWMPLPTPPAQENNDE